MDPVAQRALKALLALGVFERRSVTAVWLFGSRASGAGRADSDVDLAVLCQPPLGGELFRAIDQASLAAGVAVDVIDLATATGTLAWEVITSGRLVVEHDELATEQFVRQSRFRAEDEEQRNRMIVLASAGQVGNSRQ